MKTALFANSALIVFRTSAENLLVRRSTCLKITADDDSFVNGLIKYVEFDLQ